MTRFHATAAGQIPFTQEEEAEWDARDAAQAAAAPALAQAALAKVEADRIASLWQAAHDMEYAAISGSAIGLITMGVMQSLPKCVAVQNWIKSIWTEYYTRKANDSTDYDFSVIGACPHSVPELVAELGV